LYHEATSDAEMVEQYGKRTPTDWIENNLYTLHSKLGITCMLVIDVVLFNGWGLLIWAIQMLWIPIWAAGVINGVAHWLGYRNGESRDHSTNISAVGIVIGGEELHNNHHLQPASAKFSIKWYEFDMGWAYIKVLDKLGLAKVS
jgi:stearoyl-CoA desaturase (delta-9 desaturase)